MSLTSASKAHNKITRGKMYEKLYGDVIFQAKAKTYKEGKCLRAEVVGRL